MNKVLNFQQAKKTFLTVTFIDDKKVLVKNPTKRIMDLLKTLGDDFNSIRAEDGSIVTEESDGYEAIDEIYEICAEIMSNNIAREQITVEYLADVIDIEDLLIFFDAYVDFVTSLQASVKN